MIKISWIGADVVTKTLSMMSAAARIVGQTVLTVGSDEPYAYGIETGEHLSGKLARRAGGLYYIQEGYNVAQASAGKMLLEAITEGPGAVSAAYSVLNAQVTEAARQAETAVVTGNLRQSIFGVVSSR